MTEREQIQKEIDAYEKRREWVLPSDPNLQELHGRITGLFIISADCFASAFTDAQRETFIYNLKRNKADIQAKVGEGNIEYEATIKEINHMLLMFM